MTNTNSTDLLISSENGGVSTRTTNDDQKPRPEKCTWWYTCEVAVNRPSMYAFTPEVDRLFDAQRHDYDAVIGGGVA